MTADLHALPDGTWYANRRDRAWTVAGGAGGAEDALAFHRALPEYSPTALVDVPALAGGLGVARVLVKDESSRLGLPAFKALGASWAVHRAVGDQQPGTTTVVAATDGNHGRAVARFAGRCGQHARIFLPDGVSAVAARAIRNEGADVVVVGGSYDDAVAAAARAARTGGTILVQDTAWEGYTDIPTWIVQGYATLFAEIDEQLQDLGVGRPHLVVVPVGVGSLLQSALIHYRRDAITAATTAVLSAEAQAAACIAKSLEAGRPVSVPTGPTVMAGLNCGTPSALAWPLIKAGLDAAVAVTDAQDLRAAADLACLGVDAGPCGAAALAATRIALTGASCVERRAHLGVDEHSTVILVSTESTRANPLPDTPGIVR